MVLSDEVN